MIRLLTLLKAVIVNVNQLYIWTSVLNSDGITYFSPCQAGCDKYFFNDDRDVSII